MPSTNLRQIKAALWQQAFLGGTQVSCPRDEVRYLGLYVTELETLVEAYRAFVAGATLLSIPEVARRTHLLRDTEKILGSKDSADLTDTEETPMAAEAGRHTAHLSHKPD